MPIIDRGSGARVEEIAGGIYQLHIPASGASFSFNQYLIADDEPLLFHTGPRAFAAVVQKAIESVLPIAKLRWIAFSHTEDDECGAMDALLAAAPRAEPLTGRIGALVNGGLFTRPVVAMSETKAIELGRGSVSWVDAAHTPHGWECGFLVEHHTATLLCGDLFTQPGSGGPAVTEDDVLERSEKMRAGLDYFAVTAHTRGLLEKLAATRPRVLACMHGSAWRGDGAALLRELADRVASPAEKTL
jgi:flavorubredoxin